MLFQVPATAIPPAALIPAQKAALHRVRPAAVPVPAAAEAVPMHQPGSSDPV